MTNGLNLSNEKKHKLKQLIIQLVGDDYNVVTHDSGNTYSIYKKQKGGGNRNDRYDLYDRTWLELCVAFIPQKLGMTCLVIPTNDPEFNLADYLLQYYEDLEKNKESVVDEITEVDNIDYAVESGYNLDGSH